MQAISILLTILVTYYAYQWGSGHKKQPNVVVVIIVLALSAITTIPAYYIGKHFKEES